MLRLLQPTDVSVIKEMLSVEGLGEEDITLDKGMNYVLDEDGVVGFFNVRMESGVPYLVHFCVKRAKRCHATARKLVRLFKGVVRASGYSRAIINVPIANNYLRRLVSVYFRATPYAELGNQEFYLTEVSHG